MSDKVLTLTDIRRAVKPLAEKYHIGEVYLFGSYAKGTATERSDVDLLVSTDVSGLKFYGLAERLREALKKNIDLINVEQLSDNMDLLNEIMKEGIRIYVQG